MRNRAASAIVLLVAALALARCGGADDQQPLDTANPVDDEGYPILVKPEDDIKRGEFSCDAVRYYEVPDFSGRGIYLTAVISAIDGGIENLDRFENLDQRFRDAAGLFSRAYFYDHSTKRYLSARVVNGRFTDITMVSGGEALSENNVQFRRVDRRKGFLRGIPAFIYRYDDIYLDDGERSYRYSTHPVARMRKSFSSASSMADLQHAYQYQGWSAAEVCPGYRGVKAHGIYRHTKYYR